MIEPGPATEAEMISAFLRAEADSSSHWKDCVNAGLAAIGAERSLIDSPNLNDPAENRSRKELLYSYRKEQFAGFPADMTWRTVDLEVKDFQTVLYMDHPHWKQLSNGTRLVREDARNLPQFSSDRRFQHIVICQAVPASRYCP